MQVTNQPIDAIHEEVFADTTSGIGPELNLINPQPESCRQISAESPVLSNIELAKLKNIPDFEAATIPMLYKVADGGAGLKQALDAIFAAADKYIAEGKCILILSDRGITKDMAAVPALLAGAGLHHHLIKNGTRLRASIIIESAEPREVHHMALLLGYGVSGINPYLAFESLEHMCADGMLDISFEKAAEPALTALLKSCRRWVFLLYSLIVALRFLKLSVSAVPLLKNISPELRRVLKASAWMRLPKRLLCVMSLPLLSKTLILSAMNQVLIINGVTAASSICLIRKRLLSCSRPARPVIISSLRRSASSCAAVPLPTRIFAVC